ncbi:SIS domain-containing protein [Nocardioides sp. CCNWLW239]|uniref:SIS domain-containing protein n=1 Tax=Nocardioides sp. CCNWLW239 TaxID=3128902 RepID=UPI003019AF81
MTWFDESRLDDERALAGIDQLLRSLAESGARVRREAAGAAEPLQEAVRRAAEAGRPRAVVAAGPDSRLLRAVLEPFCPVPFVAWPAPGLPGWAGSLDLVVVLAPSGSDPGEASAAAEAVRRGAQLVVAAPEKSLVAQHAEGRDSTLLPVEGGDMLAMAILMLTYLNSVGLGPEADADKVADALDDVATACSPHRDISVNPGKILALSLADSLPVVWGGSVLAARAARRVAEGLRRASGRGAIAGDADDLLPVLEAARPRNVFDDPFAEEQASVRPVLVILDDGATDPIMLEQRRSLTEAADARGVRVEVVEASASTEVARYASLLLQGTYAAEYLRLGLVADD